MKEFVVEWETCYCEDYPEVCGSTVIKAETEEEATEKFISDKRNAYKAILSVYPYENESEDEYV